MSISSWPPMERPREKLLAAGAGSLSDAELLAVFLQTGIKGKTALELARDLLLNFGSLISANYKELCSQPGIGVAKAAGLAAMKELSLRQMMEGLKSRDLLTSSAATRDYLRARFKNCESEVFSCLFLNNQHHVMELEELFRGTIDGAAVYPREVVKRALYHNAADIAITRILKTAMQTIEVRVLDHLVIGAGEVISFAERGLL
ncbi:MAG: JAB domain-containing protein [Pseudomonadales bacterium]|nr:JAB domain-containing protein [Pseudomonadales bacterium]